MTGIRKTVLQKSLKNLYDRKGIEYTQQSINELSVLGLRKEIKRYADRFPQKGYAKNSGKGYSSIDKMMNTRQRKHSIILH